MGGLSVITGLLKVGEGVRKGGVTIGARQGNVIVGFGDGGRIHKLRSASSPPRLKKARTWILPQSLKRTIALKTLQF